MRTCAAVGATWGGRLEFGGYHHAKYARAATGNVVRSNRGVVMMAASTSDMWWMGIADALIIALLF